MCRGGLFQHSSTKHNIHSCVATADNSVMPLTNPILHHTWRQRYPTSSSHHMHTYTNMHTSQPSTHKLLPHIITICTDKGTHLDGDETRAQFTCLHNMSYMYICTASRSVCICVYSQLHKHTANFPAATHTLPPGHDTATQHSR